MENTHFTGLVKMPRASREVGGGGNKLHKCKAVI